MQQVQEFTQLIEQFESGQYFQLLGFEIDKVEYGEAIMRLKRKPDNDNMQNMLHGGAIMSGLDIAMGLASRSLGSDAVSTIQMEVRFVKSLAEGNATFHAQVLHQTNSTVILTGRVLSDENELLAYSTGTFKL
ncbi:PaaI family thioesterase [Planococcus dechangensis]|uniref:PaaI family thioesterase n=1 Tax=Planococcus dechangensis TaxID=1176255 RepID=A0ABV9M7E4_9BACL